MNALDGLLETQWAIDPVWLPRLAALAQRQRDASVLADVKGLKRADPAALAPGAQRIPGATRATVSGGVAIVPILGPIFPRANLMVEISGATSLEMMAIDLKAALADPNVKSILLLVDSPGGAVSGVAAFADLVREASKRKGLKAFITGTGASAAYWIAAAASEVTVERTSVVGSIGVVSTIPKQVEPDTDGLLYVEIVSSSAPNKRPDPMQDAGVAEIRATLDALERQFVGDIARFRGVTPAEVREKFGKGGVKIGAEAKAAGMVDRVGTFDWAIADLRRNPMPVTGTGARREGEDLEAWNRRRLAAAKQ